MVVRLEGNIDGQQIFFERESGDKWKAFIPANLNGIYIVELTATDWAGNRCYVVQYILTIDLAALCVHLEQYPYHAELLEQYCVEAFVSNFYAILQEEYTVQVALSDYYAILMIPEVCNANEI